MTTNNQDPWEHFKANYHSFPDAKLAIDLSRLSFSKPWLGSVIPKFDRAFKSMRLLELGTIANPDEERMVGHYWLRNPALAPTPTIENDINQSLSSIKDFARKIHQHEIQGDNGPFTHLLLIGIGGSALGPQLAAHALGHPVNDKLFPLFLDNTDPDGIERTLLKLKDRLGKTLVLVISKSGGTKETYNGMMEVIHAYKQANLNFSRHAVAITGINSKLDKFATSNAWLARFPMWDWVGGRTSETSVVGLLPAILQGIDIEQFISGAKTIDTLTRNPDLNQNPAALLAMSWYFCGQGAGKKDMVILPYKDRLELMSRYLQQLVMESLGKEFDLQGNQVNQGIAVYGNKGSTDQHAYVQQLRDGVHNFFVTFIEVLKDQEGTPIQVSDGITSGDYLQGFLMGTRAALHAKQRESITLTLDELTPFTLGVLIGLFERAVGLYAFVIGINAYHQPGVEAGKVAAENVIELNKQVINLLRTNPKRSFKVEDIASALNAISETESIFHLLNRFVRNSDTRVHSDSNPGLSPFARSYWFE